MHVSPQLYMALIICLILEEVHGKRISYLLAHVTAKEVEDKSEKKRLEDVPIVSDFPEVFPEDLPAQRATVDLAPLRDKKSYLEQTERAVRYRALLGPEFLHWGAPSCLSRRRKDGYISGMCIEFRELNKLTRRFHRLTAIASKKGFGAVLMQREKVDFLNASTPVKNSCEEIPTSDLDLGAVVLRSQDGRHYLYGISTRETLRVNDCHGEFDENSKFPEAIREHKLLDTTMQDGTLCPKWQELVYLVMAFCGILPSTNRRAKARWTIRTLEVMLRACCNRTLEKGWVNHLPLGQVLYNMLSRRIKAAPFDALSWSKFSVCSLLLD
ncbi:hypothetical protein Tco_1315605 [Tanacetum coccineum]